MDSSARQAAEVTATPAARVPLLVRLFSPVPKFLPAAGLLLVFNRLVTIRGRKSGLPRTAAIAVIEVAGRRCVWAPWGEVHWVRNLRAARRLGERRPDRVQEAA